MLGALVEDVLDRATLFTAMGVVTLSSVVGGYFGLGPAAILTENDESIILVAPVKPFQLFMSRYVRRVVRKMVFVFAGLVAIFPIVSSANILFIPLTTLLITVIIYFEVNYFLGGIAAYFKIKIQQRTSNPLRHLLVVFLAILAFIPTLPPITNNSVEAILFPSNAFAYIITEVTGILSWGYGPLLGIQFLALGFMISFLFLGVLCDFDYYEVFAASYGREKVEGRFSKLIRGQVDFTETRFSDPMSWIILKDFWSRMRSPLQVWKYVYVFFGTIFVIYLNVIRPAGFAPLQIPPALSSTAIPAFLLIVLLMIQLSSVTSLLSFVDEQENIYLLKASPFKPMDIILAKYLLSLMEVALAAIPILGFIAYFFRVQGFASLLTLAAPLILMFTASGIAIGAFVPVVTNDPRILPVPLAFSFPVVNLTLGAAMIAIVASLAQELLILLALPTFTLIVVFLFLGAGVRAMNSFR
jgi:ABC-type polysaccharide/polyol phosphate export permease